VKELLHCKHVVSNTECSLLQW